MRSESEKSGGVSVRPLRFTPIGRKQELTDFDKKFLRYAKKHDLPLHFLQDNPKETYVQGSRQGRASPGPAALGPPFLAGPGSPGPAGPRCSQPCRVRAGPRAMVDFKCDKIFYKAYMTVENYSSDSDIRPVHSEIFSKTPNHIYYTRINYTLLGVLVPIAW